MKKLELAIKEFIEAVKAIDDVNINDIIYRYDPIYEEYNIIHSFQELIDMNDEFSYVFGTLLSDFIFSKGYFNVNVFEDKELLKKYTTSLSISTPRHQKWNETFTNTNSSSSVKKAKINPDLLVIAA